MKSLLPKLVVAALVATPLFAGLAPYPSVLTARVDDQMLPVIRVVGSDPIVIVGNKEKRLRLDPVYLIQPAESFAPGMVHWSKVKLEGTELRNVATTGEDLAPLTPTADGAHFGTIHFEATATSKKNLSGGFVVVVIYSPSRAFTATGGDNSTEVLVHDLPELPAGVPVAVRFSGALPSQVTDVSYFMQIFDSTGREVATNSMGEASKYYSQREQMTLRAAVRRYQESNPGAVRAAQPIRMLRPLFGDSAVLPKSGVSAIVTVSPQGTVSHVEVRGVEDTNQRAAIADALGGWLFLPQLKAGEPVATKVQVPLQF